MIATGPVGADMEFEDAKRILLALADEGVRYRPLDRIDAEAIRERFGLVEDD
jgi:hypothetical protein